MNCTSYLYICIFAHIVGLLYTSIYRLTLLLNTIFHNKLLLELEDIINNWNICLRIITTLIKESKNKSCFILKKSLYYSKQGEKIAHSLLLITSKIINVIINCLSIKIAWLFYYGGLFVRGLLSCSLQGNVLV